MATVRTDAYQLPLPAGWSDRTAVTIAAPAAPDGSVPNLVITREALCDGMGLAGYADGHANLMRDQVDAFELLSNGWEELDGERALVRIVRFQRRRLGAARAAAGLPRARRPRLRHLRHGHRGGVRGRRARLPRGARRPALRRPRRASARRAPGAARVSARSPFDDRPAIGIALVRFGLALLVILAGVFQVQRHHAAVADARVWGLPSPSFTRHRDPRGGDRARRDPAVRHRPAPGGLADPGRGDSRDDRRRPHRRRLLHHAAARDHAARPDRDRRGGGRWALVDRLDPPRQRRLERSR